MQGHRIQYCSGFICADLLPIYFYLDIRISGNFVILQRVISPAPSPRSRTTQTDRSPNSFPNHLQCARFQLQLVTNSSTYTNMDSPELSDRKSKLHSFIEACRPSSLRSRAKSWNWPRLIVSFWGCVSFVGLVSVNFS